MDKGKRTAVYLPPARGSRKGALLTLKEGSDLKAAFNEFADCALQGEFLSSKDPERFSIAFMYVSPKHFGAVPCEAKEPFVKAPVLLESGGIFIPDIPCLMTEEEADMILQPDLPAEGESAGIVHQGVAFLYGASGECMPLMEVSFERTGTKAHSTLEAAVAVCRSALEDEPAAPQKNSAEE